MKRDDELLRVLLIRIEDDPVWKHMHVMTDESTDEELREYYHLQLLSDEGFLEESGIHGGCFRMTNGGQDFVRMIRDDTMWKRVKARADKAEAGVPLRVLFGIADLIVREDLRKSGTSLD